MINLNRLRELLSNDVLLKKYISLFIETAPKNLLIVNKAIKESDLPSLKVAAHSLKTQFTYLDHKEAEKIAEYLENLKPEHFIKNKNQIFEAQQSLTTYTNEVVIELKHVTD